VSLKKQINLSLFFKNNICSFICSCSMHNLIIYFDLRSASVANVNNWNPFSPRLIPPYPSQRPHLLGQKFDERSCRPTKLIDRKCFHPKACFFSPKVLTYPPKLFACRQNMHGANDGVGFVFFSFLMDTHTRCMFGMKAFILRRNLHASLRNWFACKETCMAEEAERSRRALQMEWKIEAANGMEIN